MVSDIQTTLALPKNEAAARSPTKETRFRVAYLEKNERNDGSTRRTITEYFKRQADAEEYGYKVHSRALDGVVEMTEQSWEPDLIGDAHWCTLWHTAKNIGLRQ